MSARPKDWLWRRRRAIFDRADLPASQKLVLLGVEHHADEDGACFPSVATLARETGLSERTVYRVLLELEERGLLAIDHGGGRRRRNEYVLTIAPAPNGSAQPPAPAAPATPPDETVTPRQKTVTPRQGTLTPWQSDPDTVAQELSMELRRELSNRTLQPPPRAEDDFAPLKDDGADDVRAAVSAAVLVARRPVSAPRELSEADFEALKRERQAQAAAHKAAHPELYGEGG